MGQAFTLLSLKLRLDKQAIEQLREEVARLAERVDFLEGQLDWAERDAELYRDLYTEATHQAPPVGLTQSGHLVAINQESSQ